MGHNVRITVGNAILELALLLGNDGALRGLAGQSSRFHITQASEPNLRVMIVRFLSEFPPRAVLFLFHAPMSRGGWLAAQFRRQPSAYGVAWDARTAAMPEQEFRMALVKNGLLC